MHFLPDCDISLHFAVNYFGLLLVFYLLLPFSAIGIPFYLFVLFKSWDIYLEDLVLKSCFVFLWSHVFYLYGLKIILLEIFIFNYTCISSHIQSMLWSTLFYDILYLQIEKWNRMSKFFGGRYDSESSSSEESSSEDEVRVYTLYISEIENLKKNVQKPLICFSPFIQKHWFNSITLYTHCRYIFA